jgi:hypothetical protein
MPAHKRKETPAETVAAAKEASGSYVLEWVNCGSPYCRRCSPGAAGTHGPYWYVYRWNQGKHIKRYVGKTLPESAAGDLRKRTSPVSDGGE